MPERSAARRSMSSSTSPVPGSTPFVIPVASIDSSERCADLRHSHDPATARWAKGDCGPGLRSSLGVFLRVLSVLRGWCEAFSGQRSAISGRPFTAVDRPATRFARHGGQARGERRGGRRSQQRKSFLCILSSPRRVFATRLSLVIPLSVSPRLGGSTRAAAERTQRQDGEAPASRRAVIGLP